MPLQFRVEGIKELIASMDPAILRTPLRNFFKAATILVQNKARYYAPVDTGQLRGMIVTEVDAGAPPVWGKVGVLKADEGTPIWFKARAMEYGTGAAGDKEVSHKAGHWPPGPALALWGKRHGGISGYAVAAGIGKRGGLTGRRYLRIGFALSIDRIRELVKRIGVDIASTWARRASGGATRED